MTTLVTGSAGRIGRGVSRALLGNHVQVRGLDLQPSGLSHARFDEVVASLDDREAIRQAMQGVRNVFHLGAFMSWLPQDRDRLFASNVDGTRIMLDAAIEAGVERFIFASSGEVYPEGAPERLPIDETHSTKPRSTYGLTKRIGEEMVHWAARVHGLPATILRFSHTQEAMELLDPESFFSGPRFFLHPRIRQQQAMGNHEAVAALQAIDDGTPALVLARNAEGRPYRMMITDARDMVSGLLLALACPATIGGTYNLGATEPVDFAEALPAMAKVTKLPLRVVDLPGAGVFYETSNRKFREATGFSPAFPFDLMIKEAAPTWRSKHMS